MEEKKETEKIEEKATKIFKDYEREPVPEELGRNWLEMGLVWVGIGMCLAALMLGGIVGFGLNLKLAAGAILLGGLVLTVINALCSVVGADTRLSTAMISRFAFGEYGVFIVAAVLALGCYGWFAVQLGLFGETAVTGIKILTGTAVSTKLMILIGGILMLTTAIVGIIIGLLGIYDRFVDWLMVLSVTIPPIGGVYVADYFFFHKEMYAFKINLYEISRKGKKSIECIYAP